MKEKLSLLHHSPKYKSWKQTLKKNNFKLHEEETLSIIPKGNTDSLLFSFMKVKGQTAASQEVHSCVLIRGHAVVILPVIYTEENDQPHVICVEQYRPATGGTLLEFPAGMLDDQQHQMKEVALKEFKEEVGLTVTEKELHLADHRPFLTSPGLLDEGIYYYFLEKIMPQEELFSLQGKQQGCEEENERIHLKILPFKEAGPRLESLPAAYIHLWYEKHRLANTLQYLNDKKGLPPWNS